MADFYPVLFRAVAALPVNTAETRHAIYERARGALIGQLKTIQPPMSEADIARQSDALTLSAARIEAEYEAAEKIAEQQELIVQEPPVQVSTTLPLGEPFQEDFTTVRGAPEPANNQNIKQDKEIFEARVEQLVPLAAAFAEQPSTRPRVSAPPKPSDRSGRRRTMIVGGGVGLAVLGIAIAAYIVNSTPAQNGARTPSAVQERTSTAEQRGGKLGERVGQDPTPSTSPARPELPVAQRAVLYIESQDDPQKPQTIGGRVAWRLDSESVGQGRPVETVVRANVEIPESGLNLTFTIRRNTDAAFPASHILGMRFTRIRDDGNGVVKEAGVPQFKADEGERGAPLSAITSALGENLFVSALSNVPVEIERNVDLMTRRNWVDIPIRFASGKRGIVAFEKGFSGDQTLTDAFNRWR